MHWLRQLLTTRSAQKALAAAVSEAIVDYLLDYERKIGTPSGSGADQ